MILLNNCDNTSFTPDALNFFDKKFNVISYQKKASAGVLCPEQSTSADAFFYLFFIHLFFYTADTFPTEIISDQIF